jgi:hypothetical protein
MSRGYWHGKFVEVGLFNIFKGKNLTKHTTGTKKNRSRKACPERRRRDAKHAKFGEIKRCFSLRLGVLARKIFLKSFYLIRASSSQRS